MTRIAGEGMLKGNHSYGNLAFNAPTADLDEKEVTFKRESFIVWTDRLRNRC